MHKIRITSEEFPVLHRLVTDCGIETFGADFGGDAYELESRTRYDLPEAELTARSLSPENREIFVFGGGDRYEELFNSDRSRGDYTRLNELVAEILE